MTTLRSAFQALASACAEIEATHLHAHTTNLVLNASSTEQSVWWSFPTNPSQHQLLAYKAAVRQARARITPAFAAVIQAAAHHLGAEPSTLTISITAAFTSEPNTPRQGGWTLEAWQFDPTAGRHKPTRLLRTYERPSALEALIDPSGPLADAIALQVPLDANATL